MRCCGAVVGATSTGQGGAVDGSTRGAAPLSEIINRDNKAGAADERPAASCGAGGELVTPPTAGAFLSWDEKSNFFKLLVPGEMWGWGRDAAGAGCVAYLVLVLASWGGGRGRWLPSPPQRGKVVFLVDVIEVCQTGGN